MKPFLVGFWFFQWLFFSLKDLFSQENRINFIILIFVYLFASLCRIFGIILDSNRINVFSIHYCRLVLIPYTVWTIFAIILTEMYPQFVFFNNIVSFYFFIISEWSILSNNYHIKLKLQSPLIFDFSKKN